VNELVVGSEGELYKCWASVGNHAEAVGHIRDLWATNGPTGEVVGLRSLC
jgi:uncharacterized protein